MQEEEEQLQQQQQQEEEGQLQVLFLLQHVFLKPGMLAV